MFRATDRRFKETDKLLTEKFQETDKLLTEKFRETDKEIKTLAKLFTSQWGKLVESLVEGDLVNRLNERGIFVNDTTTRRKGKHEGKDYEFDIIATNGTEVVVVEVKTTLRPKDVEKFLEKLGKVRIYLAEYADKKIYGAVAYLRADSGSERQAEKQGLYVIRATGNSSSIINSSSFQAKVF